MTAPLPDLAAGSGTWVNWNAATLVDDVPEQGTQTLLDAIFAGGAAGGVARTIDTSNAYGHGEAERRIGRAIAAHGGIPNGIAVQTKADRDLATGDFSGARIRRSLDESRERLGLDVLPVVYLHDPENTTWEEATAPGGPVEVLVEARDAGRIGRLGVAGGPSALMARYLRTGHFEALITHNRYTLADRSADRLLDLASELGVHTTNASPYGGGFLTAWPPPTDRYAYGPAHPGVRAAAEAAARICTDAGVPLIAAALRFSTDDPRVDRTIIGMRTVADLDATAALLAVDVPADVLAALRALPVDRDAWAAGWQDAPGSDGAY